jgi:hypothetical protein
MKSKTSLFLVVLLLAGNVYASELTQEQLSHPF